MKTKSIFLAVGMILMFAMVTATSCKKKESTPPPPPAYVPVFSATSIAVAADLIDFYITCVTDDYELIKVEVTYPGGLGNETYTGPMILVSGAPITFPNYFPRLSGNWMFRITGTVKSGSHIGTSFVASTQVTVSGK